MPPRRLGDLGSIFLTHPRLPDYSDPRSTIILNYGDRIRCSLTLNHTHVFGEKHRMSMLKVEGTGGAGFYSYVDGQRTGLWPGLR